MLLAAPALAAGDRSATATALRDDEAVIVDGLMDEPVWQRAEVIDAFVGQRPTEGFEPAGTTRVRIASDAKALYVFFEARLDEDRRVRAYIAEREDINDDDQVAIQLDPFGDGALLHLLAQRLGRAAGPAVERVPKLRLGRGVQEPRADRRGRLRRRDRHPLPVAVRFPKNSEQPWKFVVKRKFPARDEYVVWSPIKADDGPELLQYADLHGIEPGRSGIGLELLPTVIVRTG
ncbi:MAG: hypothetical protein GY898_01355 [Proteobacteria bacterium]|nr:hypothetical protein [Pseudomonadota bacterium]